MLATTINGGDLEMALHVNEVVINRWCA